VGHYRRAFNARQKPTDADSGRSFNIWRIVAKLLLIVAIRAVNQANETVSKADQMAITPDATETIEGGEAVSAKNWGEAKTLEKKMNEGVSPDFSIERSIAGFG
jgi:hypothetical protein